MVETCAVDEGLRSLGSGTVVSVTRGAERREEVRMKDGEECEACDRGGREKVIANRGEKDLGRRQPARRVGEGRPTGAGVVAEDAGLWYSFVPEHGVLVPGEKLEIRFTVLVSAQAFAHAGFRRAAAGNRRARCDRLRRGWVVELALRAFRVLATVVRVPPELEAKRIPLTAENNELVHVAGMVGTRIARAVLHRKCGLTCGREEEATLSPYMSRNTFCPQA